MNIFAVICTREKQFPPVTQKLIDTLSSFGVTTKVLVNQESIFSAYKKGLDACNAEDNDVVIFCHDDIELLDDKYRFIQNLSLCLSPEVGIVGPAGTRKLGLDAVWWNQHNWKNGLHRGVVKHLDPEGNIHETVYGLPGQVVVLDGLFLAARKDVWEKVGLAKPDYFEGAWDFYDIHYTSTAHNLGFKNFCIRMDILHHSRGELAGRDSWHNNRESFMSHTALPLSC